LISKSLFFWGGGSVDVENWEVGWWMGVQE